MQTEKEHPKSSLTKYVYNTHLSRCGTTCQRNFKWFKIKVTVCIQQLNYENKTNKAQMFFFKHQYKSLESNGIE